MVRLLDIETSPITGYAWGTYDTSILKVLEPSKVISVAWKELGDSTTKVKCLADFSSYKKGIVDDSELIKAAWTVLDQTDVVIAHHGDGFDLKVLNARFVANGLTAPSSYKSIDTLKVSKKFFKFDSNSLNSLGHYFGVGEKVVNGGFSLWTRCLEDGDKEAWALMKRYNVGDVELLEKVYLKLRPFIQNHPNLSAIAGDVGLLCPTCQSPNVQKRGFGVTRTGKRQRYSCQDCGAWSSGAFERSRDILSPDED